MFGCIITLRVDAVAGADRLGHEAIIYFDSERHVSGAGDAV